TSGNTHVVPNRSVRTDIAVLNDSVAADHNGTTDNAVDDSRIFSDGDGAGDLGIGIDQSLHTQPSQLLQKILIAQNQIFRLAGILPPIGRSEYPHRVAFVD